jgi:predicted TIM-barrel fold metal-dependent hydrolase
MEQVKVNATRDSILEFKESVLWNDIVRELEAWREGFNREMLSIVDDAAAENPSTASVLLHMGDLNGRLKAVDYILTLPDVFLNVLDEQKESEVSNE